MDIRVRKIRKKDAEAISLLSDQLGYVLSFVETVLQIKKLVDSGDNCVLVALHDEKIVGWIYAFKALRLETKTFIEIGGLVIDENYRGKGIGKILVSKIKEWCIEQKISSLRVRCNTKRKEAHQFYFKNGFSETKEQKVFELKI